MKLFAPLDLARESQAFPRRTKLVLRGFKEDIVYNRNNVVINERPPLEIKTILSYVDECFCDAEG